MAARRPDYTREPQPRTPGSDGNCTATRGVRACAVCYRWPMQRRRIGRARGGVRIIAGAWRGRRIAFPRGTGVRPTADRVRETLFNWLAGRTEGARCLDLYAGSGSLGLEALSRGAREVWFVEADRALAAALAEQLATLGGNGRVRAEPVERFLERPEGGPFDLVFVDPPYAVPAEPLLARLVPLLAREARVYLERAAAGGLPESDVLQWCKRARAGGVCFGLAKLRG